MCNKTVPHPFSPKNNSIIAGLISRSCNFSFWCSQSAVLIMRSNVAEHFSLRFLYTKFYANKLTTTHSLKEEIQHFVNEFSHFFAKRSWRISTKKCAFRIGKYCIENGSRELFLASNRHSKEELFSLPKTAFFDIVSIISGIRPITNETKK